MLIMFSYNFLHHKTQDYIFYCHHYGIKIDAVIAADYVELNFPPKKYRYHIRRIGQIHPRDRIVFVRRARFISDCCRSSTIK